MGTKVIVEKKFLYDIEEVEYTCTLHWYALEEDARYEEAGIVCVSIHGVDEYDHFEFALWGNGETDDEYEKDFDGCYICLPETLGDEDEYYTEPWLDGDDSGTWHFSDIMWVAEAGF